MKYILVITFRGENEKKVRDGTWKVPITNVIGFKTHHKIKKTVKHQTSVGRNVEVHKLHPDGYYVLVSEHKPI